MKEWIKYILAFIGGMVLVLISLLFVKGLWDFKINIVDMLMLIVTIALSIGVLYLSKAINKKDIVRDLIVTDLEKLIELYEQNSVLFDEIQDKTIEIDTARKEVRLIFHKADLIIDCINKELGESFPLFLKKVNDADLLKITTTYYKWVTGGELFEKQDFQITTDFLKKHETSLYNTISSIKLIVHKLVRFI